MSGIVSLVGARCSGKTTCGRALAERLGWAFVDLDDELGAPAGELLSGRGEAVFRRIEARALRRVVGAAAGSERPTVLATGGGAVLDAGSRRILRGRTRCIWLRCEPRVLAERLGPADASRPSLTGAPPAEEFSTVLEIRAPLYAAAAEHAIDVDRLEPAEVVGRLAEWLEG